MSSSTFGILFFWFLITYIQLILTLSTPNYIYKDVLYILTAYDCKELNIKKNKGLPSNNASLLSNTTVAAVPKTGAISCPADHNTGAAGVTLATQRTRMEPATKCDARTENRNPRAEVAKPPGCNTGARGTNISGRVTYMRDKDIKIYSRWYLNYFFVYQH